MRQDAAPTCNSGVHLFVKVRHRRIFYFDFDISAKKSIAIAMDFFGGATRI